MESLKKQPGVAFFFFTTFEWSLLSGARLFLISKTHTINGSGLCRMCDCVKGAFVWDQSGIRKIGIMQVSVCLGATFIPAGIPRFPFPLFCSQGQNNRNIFRNVFLFRNIPNECALNDLLVLKTTRSITPCVSFE